MNYQLVQLASGAYSIRSLAHGETFHPVIGPVAEAQGLYVDQLKICERLKKFIGEFVIWDVGLGAAANVLTVLRATQEIPGRLKIISFDHTKEPLEFALKNSAPLGYFDNHENQIIKLLTEKRVEFQNGNLNVNWEFNLGDFPESLAHLKNQNPKSKFISPPHAILFDAFSPAKNPAMWTLPLFQNLFAALDPNRPCALTTYSRSTILRVTLLLAGFFVGAGHATGMKEETTIAANDLNLISEPLGLRWLDRARRSHSAEPLREPVYSRTPLAATTMEKLRQHPQFNF